MICVDLIAPRAVRCRGPSLSTPYTGCTIGRRHLVRWQACLGLVLWLATQTPPATCRAEPPEAQQADQPTTAPSRDQAAKVGGAKLIALEKLNTALRNEPNLSPQFKDAFAGLITALRHETIEAPFTTEREKLKQELIAMFAEQNVERDLVLGAVKDILDNLDVYGDVRLRHETDNNADSRPTRNRERVRFRLGAIYNLSDELVFGARMLTGNEEDPRSSHQNLGNTFNSFDISLDRLYVTYRPEKVPDLWITAGKFAHPFRSNPVYGELVWDADVQPEGISAGYTLATEEMKVFDRVDFAIGEYLILQQNELDEASAFVVQVSGEKALTSNLDLLTIISWYRYSDLTPDGGLAFRLKNSGNAIRGDEFLSRFSILNPIVAMTYKGLPKPLTFSGEYIFNTRAARNDGEGWALGLSYGETRKAKDWRAYYQYQYIERDAVMSALSQDDFTLATNFQGHVMGVQYQFTDVVGINVWTLFSERLSSDSFFSANGGDDQWRFRIDLNIKF